MVRRIAKLGPRALILLLALGAQASLPASFGQPVLTRNPQAGTPALPGIPALQGTPALPGPAAQSLPAQNPDCEAIAFGTAIDRELSRGEQRCFSFNLSAGQFVQALVEQRGIDVVVSIFGQGGKRLTSVDRLNGAYGPETASLIAPSSGVYRLQIQSDQSASIRGRFRVTLKEPRATIPSDEKRMTAEKLAFEAELLRNEKTADAKRRAIEKYEMAGALWREVGDLYEEGIALYGAGFCYRSLSSNHMAVAVFERSIELMRDAKDDVGIAIVQGAMGFSYYYLGALDQALENFEQSLQGRQRMMGGLGAGLLHYGIGWVRIGRNENKQALESFKESLRLRLEAKDPKGAALTRIGLGKAYFRLEHYDESRAMLEDALKTMSESEDVSGQSEALRHLGWVDIRQKEYAIAKGHFQELLKLSLVSDDRYGEANARLGLAVLARRAGELQDAIDLIKRGVEIFELDRTEGSDSPLVKDADQRLRIDFFAQAQEYYEVYIDLLMRLDGLVPSAGHAAEALYVSERARARNLLDLLARAGARGAELGAARPLRVDEIQRRLLDENTVLLEFALGTAGDPETDRSFVWLVTSTSVEGHLLPKRVDIEAAAHRVYESLTARNSVSGPRRRELIAQSDAKFQVEARELSRILFSPVAAKLTGKRLLIAPQGALQFVPFAALPSPEAEGGRDRGTERQRDGETEGQRYRENSGPNFSPSLLPSVSPSPHRPVAPPPRPSSSYTPLIAGHEVIVAPSASALVAIARQTAMRRPAERSVIVFADPVFSATDDRVGRAAGRRSTAPRVGETRSDDSSTANAGALPNLSRLSATEWEARRIASLVGDSRVVSNFAASRGAALDPALGEYRFIHFATHAVINLENPELSAIALSQVDERGRPLNGLLSTQDIYHLKLSADLVVLSACRTGLGKDAAGEGLLSLTRGFLSSGAARVIVTLWSIEDQATAEMMTRFYRRMLGPQAMTPAAALRATQEEMWREGRWGAPYYWGGFVLQGDWR
jgi:CHAT domain-containing protein/tetratricopeptide (TPR) repeat protein